MEDPGYGVAPSDTGFVITLTRIGYAVGVFLIVRWGEDTVNRKCVVPLIMLGATVALAATAATPSSGHGTSVSATACRAASSASPKSPGEAG